MIVWNEQSVRWFRSASEYTGYNRSLAALLLEYLPSGGTLCDMGCGCALIDFELAPHFQEITCVDIDPEAAAAVRRQAESRGISNLHAVHADGTTLDGHWDAVMALYHGGADAFDRYYEKAEQTLLLVTRRNRAGNFGPENRRIEKCTDIAGIAGYLNSRGIRYTLREAAIEFGQPFESMEDARLFIQAYAMPTGSEELDRYLERSLQSTGRTDYPYYLPKTRELGIFVIRRSDNTV